MNIILCQQKTSPEPLKMSGEKTPSISEIIIKEIKNPNSGGKGNTQERKEKFLIKARKIHGNKYDYSKVNFINTSSKIEIICPIHGTFLQTPHNHLHNRGCKKCGIVVRSSSRATSTKDFVKKATHIYKNKYDYSKFIYVRSFIKGIIICPIHGDFAQTPNNHLRGAECPLCFGTPKKSSAEFVKDATELWGNKCDYSRVEYDGNKKKVCIICKKHGEFFQKPNDHLTGYGCPRCQTSKGELKIEQYLIAYGIDYVRQKRFVDCINPTTGQKLKFDFYLPAVNLLIEYDGEQHFRGGYVGCHKMTDLEIAELKTRDGIKTAYAKSKGIRLLRIKYTSLHKIDIILSQKLHLTSRCRSV